MRTPEQRDADRLVVMTAIEKQLRSKDSETCYVVTAVLQEVFELVDAVRDLAAEVAEEVRAGRTQGG